MAVIKMAQHPLHRRITGFREVQLMAEAWLGPAPARDPIPLPFLSICGFGSAIPSSGHPLSKPTGSKLLFLVLRMEPSLLLTFSFPSFMSLWGGFPEAACQSTYTVCRTAAPERRREDHLSPGVQGQPK